MPRSPEVSKELHQFIRDKYIYSGMSCRAIANEINGTVSLRSRFGDIDQSGVFYHVQQIREELEDTINEDALDTYVAEFIRLKESLDADIEAVDAILATLEPKTKPEDRDVWLRTSRFRKELKEMKMKLLQDVELPIRVKKLKRERQIQKKYSLPKTGGLVSEG